ncbi:MAG: GxxExxY protein [Candidatus Bathyarchaeia archaeon]
MNLEPLSKKEENTAKKIVDAAYCIHKELGPGLLERVYEVCFCYELTKSGLFCRRQMEIPIVYDGITFENGLKVNVLVENLIICELKAVDDMNPILETQVLNHLKFTGKRLGFLINFNEKHIKDGIKRIIL